MNDEILTLSMYFAERERRDGRFLAETLLDLLDERGVNTSVMLRGIAGLGSANIARSDRSLSLSEDSPVSIAAVDTPDRISSLAGDVVSTVDRGMITVQRGRFGHGSTPALGGDVRLSLYLARRQRIAGAPGYVAVCDALHRLGFAAAEVLLGVDGTVAGERRKARFFSRNAEVPLVVVGVGSGAQAAAALEELRALVPEPLFTVEPVLVCKSRGGALAVPGDVTGPEPFRRLTVRTAEDTHHEGRPIHRALIQRLKEYGHSSGATVLRGIWGFHGGEEPHGDGFPQLTRHVPVSTVIVGAAATVTAIYPIVDELTGRDGLVTCEAVHGMLTRLGDQSVGELGLN